MLFTTIGFLAMLTIPVQRLGTGAPPILAVVARRHNANITGDARTRKPDGVCHGPDGQRDSPVNFATANTEVIAATVAEEGNFVRGAKHLSEDVARQPANTQPEGPKPFEVGVNLATAPGKVVFRNDLIELIADTARDWGRSPVNSS